MNINNKGFTLIELIVTVVIISVLGVVASVSVIGSINNAKEKSYDIMVSNIVTGAISMYEEIYSDNFFGLESSLSVCNACDIDIDDDKEITITLQDLVNNGFLSGILDDDDDELNGEVLKKIIDPKTNADIGGCMISVIRNDNNGVSYDIVSYNTSGNDSCPDDYEKWSK